MEITRIFFRFQLTGIGEELVIRWQRDPPPEPSLRKAAEAAGKAVIRPGRLSIEVAPLGRLVATGS